MIPSNMNGDASNGHVESPQNSRAKVLELNRKRADMEKELQQSREILRTNGVGMSEELIDAEGFPRNDVDVHSIRIARNRVICLENDLRSVNKEIEDVVFGYFESAPDA